MFILSVSYFFYRLREFEVWLRTFFSLHFQIYAHKNTGKDSDKDGPERVLQIFDDQCSITRPALGVDVIFNEALVVLIRETLHHVRNAGTTGKIDTGGL